MKNIKKTLIVILILALALGGVSAPYAADDPGSGGLSDIAGIPGENQIIVCNNLGIIEGFPDGTYQPNQMVNRAQFAALITRALGVSESVLAGYTNTSFLDTQGYGWAVPYLAFCAEKGIMLGDGRGNAMPGRTISTNEAMTMILRTIGYTENSNAVVGSWPANYVTLAHTKKLYDNIVGNATTMDRQNSAIALYNALTVQLVSVDANGITTERWEDADGKIPLSLVNTGLGCTLSDGLITPDYYNNSYINVADRLGAYGQIFVNKDGYLVAFKPETVFLTGIVKNGRFEAEDGRTYVFSQNRITRSDLEIYWNGDYNDSGKINESGFPGSPHDAIDAFASRTSGFRTDGSEITISAEVSGATIIKIFALLGWAANGTGEFPNDEWEYYDNLFSYDFALNDNQRVDKAQFSLVGAADFDKIENGAPVYVYTNDRGEIRKVAAGKRVSGGELIEANETELTVGGKEYYYASNFLAERYNDAASPDSIIREVGADIDEICIDAYGYAYDIHIAEPTDNYGAYIGGSNNAISGNLLKLLTVKDVETTFNVTEFKNLDYYKARVPGEKKRDSLTTTNNLEGLSAKIFGYKLNDANRVVSLEEGKNDTIQISSRNIIRIDGKTITVSSDAAIFSDEGDGSFSTASLAALDLAFARGKDIEASYILNGEGDRINALVIPEEYLNLDKEEVYMAVNDVTTIADNAQRFKGSINGSADQTVDSVKEFTRSSGRVTRSDLAVVTFYKLVKDVNNKVKTTDNLVASNSDDRFITEEKSGVQVAASSPVDAETRMLKLDDGGLVSIENATFYKATLSNGIIKYDRSEYKNISGGSWIWAFSVEKDPKNVTGDADVIIWMDNATHNSVY